MHQINEENFLRLKKWAEPLVDTLDDVLARILTFYETHQGDAVPKEQPMPWTVLPGTSLPPGTFPGDSPPNLAFTSIRTVTIDNKPFENRFWNPVLFEVIARAATKLGHEALRKNLDVNYVEGQGSAKSFVWIPEAGISVQGRDANLCWRSIYKLVQAAGITIEIDFYWQHNEKATFPGKSGRFSFNPV